MTEYRQRLGSDVWHLHPRCQWWPILLGWFKTRTKKPTSGELCNECQAKTRRDEA